MKEICREVSEAEFARSTIGYVALAVIGASCLYEANNYYTSGVFSVPAWGMNVLFLGLWIWRVAFKYEYILRETELEVISFGLGIRRSYTVDLTKTESFSDRYVKSFFRKTKIGHYIHRYSSVDGNQQRILVFREGKGLAALLFKCSDKFLKEMKKLMPDKYLGA